MKSYRVQISMLVVADDDPADLDWSAMLPESARMIDVETRRVPRDPDEIATMRKVVS